MEVLCFPRALNYVLALKALAVVPGATLAEVLGLTVPPELARDFPFAAVSSEPKEWGVHVLHKERLLEQFLAKHGTFVSVRFLPAATISRTTFVDLIADNIAGGHSLLVGYRDLRSGQNSRRIAHVAAIISASRRDIVTYHEPEAGSIEEISGDGLYGAMREVDGGIWLISPIGIEPQFNYPS